MTVQIVTGSAKSSFRRVYNAYTSEGDEYELTAEPASYSALDVYVGGIIQPKDGSAYSYSGTTLTLSEDPGDELVEIVEYISTPKIVDTDTLLDQIYSASETAFSNDTMIPGRSDSGTLIKSKWGTLSDNISNSIITSVTGNTADFLAGSANTFIPINQAWGAAVPVNLGSLSGNVTLDFSTFIHAYGTVTGNITLNAVSNPKHQTGTLELTSSGGNYTVSLNANTFSGEGAVIPNGQTWLFSYFVRHGGKVHNIIVEKDIS